MVWAAAVGRGHGASVGFSDIVLRLAGDPKHVPSDYIFVLGSSRGKMGARFHVSGRNVWPQRHGRAVCMWFLSNRPALLMGIHQTGPINTWPAGRREALFLSAIGASEGPARI